MGEVLAGLFAIFLGALAVSVPVVSLVLGVLGWQRGRRVDARLADAEDTIRLLHARLAALEGGADRPAAAGRAAAEVAGRAAAEAVGRAAAEAVAPQAPAGSPSGAPAPAPSPADEAPPPTPALPGAAPLAAPPSATGDAPPPTVSPASPPRVPVSAERMAAWVAGALGAGLVLLASLFALGVAIERGYLGPPMRVFLGLGSATALLLGGQRARGRGFGSLAAALTGAGFGVAWGVIWAAAGLYGLLPRPVAFGLTVGVTAVATLSAAVQGQRLIAWLGLLGGLATPVLLSTGENRALALFTYVVVLVSGVLVAAARRGWADLAVGAAVGAAALHLGWASRYHLPSEVPVALGAALALALPFAVAGRAAGPVGAVARVGAALLPVVALPWVLPVDPRFFDPRSAVEAVRPLGVAPWFAAAGVALVAAPGLAVAARQRDRVSLVLAAGLGAVLALVFGVGHATGGAGLPTGPLLLGVGLPWLVAAAWVPRAAPGASALAAWGPAFGLALAALAGARLGVAAAGVAAGLALLVAGGLGLALRTGRVWLLPAVLAGAAAGAAALAAERLDGPTTAAVVAAPGLIGVALLGTVPLGRRWGQGGDVAAITAALATPAFFYPLYAAWQAGLGDPVIGLLPLLLAAVALLGARAVVVVHGGGRDSGTLALFVAVVLAGVTTALPLQLRDQWLTVALALEAAALVLLVERITHPLLRVLALGLGLAVAVRLCLNPAALAYGTAGGVPILNWTLYTWGLPAVALAFAALRAGRPGAAGPAWWARAASPAFGGMAVAVGFALVNVQVSHAFQDAGPLELGGHGLLQGMVRSIAWAAYGLALLIGGLLRGGSRWVRLVGFGMLLLGAGKVFVVDLWSLSGFVRVGSVLGLGVLLLVAAFLFERLVLRERRP